VLYHTQSGSFFVVYIVIHRPCSHHCRPCTTAVTTADPAVTTGLSVAGILQLQLSEKQVKGALQAQWDKGLADGQQAAAVLGPRHSNCPGDQILLCTYVSGVRARDLSVRPLHLTATDLSFAQLQRICRMRLGWHALAITTGRFTRTPRGERVCKLCSFAGHANVFGCGCPVCMWVP
jgi:hypothetical protein